MGHPLVIEPIRRRIVYLLEQKWTYSQVADALGVGVATVNRVWRLFRETGSTRGLPRKGGKKSTISADQEIQFRALLERMPMATYDELTVMWNRSSEKKISRSAVIRKVLKLGYSRKKKSHQATEKLTAANKSKRTRFQILQRVLPSDKLVFLDEAGFQCKLSRQFGRSLRGTRLVRYESAGRSRNFTIVGAVRRSGRVVMRGSSRSMTLVRFLSFLRFHLLPRSSPKDVLVMDDLAAHKHRNIRRLCLQWIVRVIYPPPYCPEYNPIEQVWAWMKNRLRGRLNRAASSFRYAISGAWRKSQGLNMARLFQACGYIRPCESI